MQVYSEYASCHLCPRECGADRLHGGTGICQASAVVRLGRAALHFWEEPCLSGKRGSGAVFFSGCNLHCIYCQNGPISAIKQGALAGKDYSVEELSRIYLALAEQGANNINLVTAAHYLPQVVDSLKLAKREGLSIPVVYNSSGYEKVESLRKLEGLVDIYLPDLKYLDASRAQRYSAAPDYPETAKKALDEMVRQVGDPVFEEMPHSGEEQPLMQKGVIVRHLCLPEGRRDSEAVIDYLYQTYGNRIYMSIMKQYTPVRDFPEHPELSRRLARRTYDKIIDHALSLGVSQAFIQEGPNARESFIPAFDGTVAGF